ncbi:MAG TPA: DUF1345 domain-containing protein [Chitinophagaceae bacterium]
MRTPGQNSIVLFINYMKGFQKLLAAFLIGAAVFFIFPLSQAHIVTHFMMGWDAFCLAMLAVSWLMFFSTTSKQIRRQASKQDETGVVIFTIVIISTFASLLAVLLIFISKTQSTETKAIELPIALAGMIFSWLLVHTIFALRYAHTFYGNDKNNPEIHLGGLEFPEDKDPDYLDFAYFSFVVGMTFQVSDTQVTSKKLRRLVLLHGLLSFGFNTFIVALTINVIAGLAS